jgi:hypothetical protein
MLSRLSLYAGKARVLLLLEQRADVADGGRVADRHDIRTRRHHLADQRVAKVDDALQEPALFTLNDPLFGRGVDVGLGRLVRFVHRLVWRCHRHTAARRRDGARDPARHRAEDSHDGREGWQQEFQHALGIAADDGQRQEQLAEKHEARHDETTVPSARTLMPMPRA